MKHLRSKQKKLASFKFPKTDFLSVSVSYDPPLSSTFADDTISVHTDMSDDDQFVVLDNGEPSMFDEIFPRNKDRSVNPPAGADVGEEACEIQPPNAHAVDLITKHLQRQVRQNFCPFCLFSGQFCLLTIIGVNNRF